MEKVTSTIENVFNLFNQAFESVQQSQHNLEKSLIEYKATLEILLACTSQTEMLLDDFLFPGIRLQQFSEATKQIQEIQMSFNLQYLMLQNNMQNENRNFSMISNIMKTKHETVKNTISNVR